MFEQGPCCGDAHSRVILRPTGTDCVADLWHPYPSRWAGTIQSVVELLDDLVDALGRDTESSACINSGDGVVSGQPCPVHQDVESCPVLIGYGFDISGHCLLEGQCRLALYGGSEAVEVSPDVAPIAGSAGCGHVTHGRSRGG